MRRIDDAVRRILRVKFRAGLFEHPFVDPDQAEGQMLLPDAVAASRKAASRSMVLLKNDGGTLPLQADKKTAVIGPLAKSGHDMLGGWWGRGRDEDAVTVFDGINAQSPGATFAQGCTLSNASRRRTTRRRTAHGRRLRRGRRDGEAADQVVLALGETREMSAEAAARSEIDLPGRQEELIERIKATGKPFVVVLFNGRPLTLGAVDASSPAILEAWFPGVQAGNAVADVLFGKVNPGGKLPVSFPRRVGQMPIYYNHEPAGRPCDVTSKWNSRYRDLASCDPQYPFGFGLSYSKFEISNLQVSRPTVSRAGRIRVTVKWPTPRARRATRSSSSTSTTRGEHLAARAQVARLRAGDAQPGREARGQLHARPQRLRVL